MKKRLLFLLCFNLCLAYHHSRAQTTQPAPDVNFRQPWLNLQKLTFKSVESGVRKIYTHIKFKELTQKHHQVAILPVEIIIDQNEISHMPAQDLNHRAFVEAKNAYPILFASLQKEKVMHRYNINFQDISETQRILSENDLTPDKLKSTPAAKLAALLGVDAIITCSIVRDEKLVAEAKTLENLRRSKGLVGPSAGTATVNIYDGRNNELLWQFERLLTAGLGNNMHETMLNLGNRMAMAFPYFKPL
ncbi:hypothetical protein AAE02nite_36570 [Adhaeribacter aerolatus]|uniref:Uncharacterized protein n=1 Tax=Adhaeribacter aerolatus TaxID=670289 RepID=A0A512B210_9BACT|nr:hypothetical protein [Adhaeribacter aerolatus]GEO05993.1 hypothetical protein AAE02nite_36570 [Adhaeribacter aerolatus]